MAIALMKIMNSHNHTTYREYFMDYDAEYSALPGLDECCMGSIAISGESNTRYILGGDGVWRQDISTVTPYRFQPNADGKVVQNGNLIEQSQATIEENGAVDTTTIKTVIVDVPGPVLEEGSEEISANGTYTFEPGAGVDGFSTIDVTVDVPTPEPTSIPLDVTISDNGEYDYDPDRSGVDYFSSVSLVVEVPEPETTQLSETISDNGTYDFNPANYGVDYFDSVSLEVDVPQSESPEPTVTSLNARITSDGIYGFNPSEYSADYFDSVYLEVDVSPALATVNKSYATNGTYTITPPDGYDGIDEVNILVDVASLDAVGVAFGSEVHTSGEIFAIPGSTLDSFADMILQKSGQTGTLTWLSGFEALMFGQTIRSMSNLSANEFLAALGNGMFANTWSMLQQKQAVVYLRLASQVLSIDSTLPLVYAGSSQSPFLISTGMMVDESTTPPGTTGGYLRLGLDGNGDPEFQSMYLMQNGTLTDVIPYLSQFTFSVDAVLYV